MKKSILILLSVFSFSSLLTFCDNTEKTDSKIEKKHFLPSENKVISKDKPSLNKAENFQSVLRAVAKKVEPAVVNIRAEKKVTNTRFPRSGNPFHDLLPNEPQQRNAQAIGAGFIISKEGYIMTNNHVIEGAENITVFLGNEKEYKATIVGRDTLSDLAILSIKTGSDLPVAVLGDSSTIQPGSFAIAIGNPFGLTGSFTFGVVSATGRMEGTHDKNAAFKNFIQTDASINQGNSGGPLLNIYGQVIGVNTAIFSAGGAGSVGIGFAIPINVAKKIAIQLIEKGQVDRGYIGVEIHNLSDDLIKHFKLTSKQGAFVNTVVSEGPADKAGMLAGDVILKVNEKPVKNASSLVSIISAYLPGEKVILTLFRQRKEIEVSIIIGKRPNEEAIANKEFRPNGDEENSKNKINYWMGLAVDDLQDYRQRYRIKSKKGVVITHIQPSSVAEEKSLRVGDIIESINYQPINDLKTFNRFIETAKNENSFLLAINRNGQTKFIVLNK